VASLVHLVRTSRLVVLTGPAGIGKTRLALRVAAELANGGDVQVVEMAPVGDPALVAQAVASSVGLRPGRASEIESALVTHLRTRRLLLVMDNCEHLVDACASLAERLLAGCADVSILATSQVPLGIAGERILQVPPLSTAPDGADGDAAQLELAGAEAVTLFCDRAAAVNPRFTLHPDDLLAVTEICRRLDGMPLAIELAAARTATLSIVEIAERLSDRFSLLTGGGRTAPVRHQTLRGALDWSYELLAEPEQAMLARASVFTGGFTLRAAQSVCIGDEVGAEQVVDLLGTLVAKSLVVAHTGGRRARYRLLDTVRAYAWDRLDGRGETDECRRRHATWFTQLAGRSSQQLMIGDHQAWLETLDAEYDNLVSALQWSLGHGDDELALRLAGALVPFWHQKGYFSEGRTRLQRVLEAARGEWPALRARALNGVGLLATMQGDLSTARTALEQSLSLSRARGYRRATASALRLLGFVALFAQDARSAIPVLEEGVAMARTEGDAASLGDALALYGRAHLFLGDAAGARRVFEECRQVEEEVGEVSSNALIGLGWTALAEGEHRCAASSFEQALAVARRAGKPFQAALALSFLGELEWLRGNLCQARARLDEGLALAEGIDAPFPRARCLLGLGQIELAEGDCAAAAGQLEQAKAVSREAQLPWVMVRCLQAWSQVREASGDLVGARSALDESLALARSKADRAGIAGSLFRLGTLARAQRDERRAASLAQEALALFAEIGDSAGVADALEALAGLAAAGGRHAHAARLFGAAESQRQRCGAKRTPQLHPDYESDRGVLRSALEPSELESAWAQGAALSRDEVLALASRGRGGRSRPASGWASLTPTERRVVDLAAQGLTNREIGERLFVSPRTVQAHLLRIFPKLDIRSRRELRRFRNGDPAAAGEAHDKGRNTEN